MKKIQPIEEHSTFNEGANRVSSADDSYQQLTADEEEPALCDEQQYPTSIGVTILPHQVLNEAELAHAFHKHPVTIRRAVARGELPQPIRLMGKPTWTGTIILQHLDARLKRASDEAQIFRCHPPLPSKSKLEKKG